MVLASVETRDFQPCEFGSIICEYPSNWISLMSLDQSYANTVLLDYFALVYQHFEGYGR